jgi:hypothetical protein
VLRSGVLACRAPVEVRMAPIEQYLMTDRDAEIALARSSAPESISRDAEVLVLGRHGFETAVKGKNGFVCIVGRSNFFVGFVEFRSPVRLGSEGRAIARFKDR